MPGCALADLARSSGGANVLVSCRRAESLSSARSLIDVGLLFVGRASILPDEAADRSAGAGAVPEFETLERERRYHRRPEERVATQRAGRLPDAGLDDGLGSLPRRDVPPEDGDVRFGAGRLANELERVPVVKVPQLVGV